MQNLQRTRSNFPFQPWAQMLIIQQSQALLNAIKEYETNKWKVIGQKVGKPAKVSLTDLLYCFAEVAKLTYINADV
jgi:hypothetical protein